MRARQSQLHGVSDQPWQSSKTLSLKTKKRKQSIYELRKQNKTTTKSTRHPNPRPLSQQMSEWTEHVPQKKIHRKPIKYLKKIFNSLSMREMPMKPALRFSYSSQNWESSKHWWGCGKEESIFTANRNANMCSHYRTECRGPSEKLKTTIWSLSYTTLGCLPKRNWQGHTTELPECPYWRQPYSQ